MFHDHVLQTPKMSRLAKCNTKTSVTTDTSRKRTRTLNPEGGSTVIAQTIKKALDNTQSHYMRKPSHSSFCNITTHHFLLLNEKMHFDS